ncbi:uncharacterized protein CcaverHIS019_0109570 [Cutaneotrichosporon cavernicola]|uniref:SET domain-containing protein n=1 Tax=Cutaneotrichosporon cavernicola TaxID=279322 RepID=A0AA48HZ65_9TREE|nr:uncharacterized protein CcaverHIS019_0109570 [Cutaneotrichosporon cavernicola]BEI88239.1 hypothetical protein CcaverHIS019_0109570 [Cutaneotrichosporon cavernicola]BEI96010.1 hypothetical protein CcaverHIS631_0109590 [Cutaneotrichosporon cavernicola]BEJ03784.1 hypothetical protein CcaverHIS641_0109590 [Cutaneotrichosporon cavernicola]
MPRGYPNPKPPSASLRKPDGKVRRFFSKVTPLPPFLQVAAVPSSPRPITSERVLAALQPDSEVVDAAKTFVKEKMGDDKYEVVADKPPVTRTATTTGAVIRKPIPPGKLAAVKPATAKVPGRRGRPPGKLHNVLSAKTVVKRLTGGAQLRGTVASRLKVNARTRQKEEPVTRKSTLRSHTTPHVTDSTPAPPSAVSPPVPSVSSSSTAPAAEVTPVPTIKLSLSLNPGSGAEGITVGSQEVREANPAKRKEYMGAGLYCQDEDPPEEAQLVERVLHHKGIRKPGRPRKSIQFLPPIPTPEGMEPSFPPFPLDHGYRMFFDKEVEFRLPYNIMWERNSGALDGKKRPPSFGKLRTNQFVERSKRVAERAVCKCDPSSDCGDNCMNRHMNYLCGKDCPTGERCTNKSLTRRQQKAYRVVWTGSRGFGMQAGENIAEGEFVLDYRGEVIDMEEFCNRIDGEYKGTRNFYALHYDGVEVVDAGMRGNDARFINHGCSPNLEVRKLETLGDGFEEYEIGFWATRDIKAGEELLYDYNFEAFSVGELANDEVRVRCQCGASNCVGFLGRRSGEKSAKELARDMGRQTEVRGKRKATPGELVRPLFAKRGPGRPRKDMLMPPPPPPPTAGSSAGPSAPSTSIAIDAAHATPIKRKPGRPRIHPLPDPNVPRRKPGRPRIHPLPDPSVPRRKPGRPRKHPPVVPTTTTAPAPRVSPKSFWDSGSAPGPKANPTLASGSEAVSKTVTAPAVMVTASAGVAAVASEAASDPTQTPTTGPDASIKREVIESEQHESEAGPIGVGASNKRSAPYAKSAPFLKKKKPGPGRPRKYPLPSPPPGAKRGPGRPRKIRNPEDELPVLGPRITPKQAEKAKRNGAPAGWAFVPVVHGAQPVAQPAPAPPREPTPPPASNRALRAARLSSVRQDTPGA